MKKWLALAAALLIGGCSDKPETQAPAETTAAPAATEAPAPAGPQKVVIYNWTEYIPAAVLEEFTKETGIEVESVAEPTGEAWLVQLEQAARAGQAPADVSDRQLEELHVASTWVEDES